MKYYHFTHIGANRKEIGMNPQSTTGHLGDIQKDFLPAVGRIDFDFGLPAPIMEKRAKPTTLLSVVFIQPWFLVIKNYFVEFLKGFEIGPFQSWDIKVHHNKSIIEDYCLFILNNTWQEDFIDFKKSSFYIGKYSDSTFIGETLAISDYQNYLSTREVLPESEGIFIKHRHVVLNLSSVKLDMFRIINTPASGYYVSERLKHAIEEKRFTGMVFKEISEVDKRIEVIYWGKGHQAHNTIHLHEKLNSIPLPSTGHLTGHPAYNIKVGEVLTRINNQIGNNNNLAFSELEKFFKYLDGIIQNNPNKNLGEIAALINF